MVTQVVEVGGSRFQWLDLVNPTKPELERLALQHGLHPTSIQDCLEPGHLPKFEKIGNLVFLIVRSYHNTCSETADTVQELTRRVAIFLSDDFLITIHWDDPICLTETRDKWQHQKLDIGGHVASRIVSEILRGMLASYDRPINQSLAQLEEFEKSIFSNHSDASQLLQNGHFLKSRASVIKRMLRQSIEILNKFQALPDFSGPSFQDLREYADRLHFYSEELLETTNSLLNLHIQLSSQRTNEASHRTNEVMRLLTVFSVFFMPLNFIAGVYGMNFQNMPELTYRYGYPGALVLMTLVSVGIYTWFRHKGWLR